MPVNVSNSLISLSNSSTFFIMSELIHKLRSLQFLWNLLKSSLAKIDSSFFKLKCFSNNSKSTSPLSFPKNINTSLFHPRIISESAKYLISSFVDKTAEIGKPNSEPIISKFASSFFLFIGIINP